MGQTEKAEIALNLCQRDGYVDTMFKSRKIMHVREKMVVEEEELRKNYC